MARCDLLAQCSEEQGRITRTFCTAAMRDAHRLLRDWMQGAGMSVRVDDAGNMIGAYLPVGCDRRRRVLIGSHLDTVVDAGRYDGALGVLMGVATVEALRDADAPLPWALEIVGFSEEEGVRFRSPFIGSRALIGALDAEMLTLRDDAGVSVAEALREFGCDPTAINQRRTACDSSDSIVAFIEPHIEQGPQLEKLDEPLGLVTAIAGQSRLAVEWTGGGGHAGTTPMAWRRDPLPIAGRWAAAVEKAARATPGLVATVGRLTVDPNVPNCIPRRVAASLDVRHQDDALRVAAVERLVALAQSLADDAKLTVNIVPQHDHAAVAMNERLIERLAGTAAAIGRTPPRLVSGAGHDAAVLAAIAPAAMLFLRSPGGVSHHPAEAALASDVALGIECLVQFILDLAT